MKDITVMIDGKKITIPEADFWKVYGKLHEEAEKENIRGAINCYACKYKMSKKTYDAIVDSIYENMEWAIECWNDQVYFEQWNRAIEDFELEEAI